MKMDREKRKRSAVLGDGTPVKRRSKVTEREKRTTTLYTPQQNALFDKFRGFMPEWSFYDATHLRSEEEFDSLVETVIQISSLPLLTPICIGIVFNKENRAWVSKMIGPTPLTEGQEITFLRLKGWFQLDGADSSRFYTLDRRMTKHVFRRAMQKDGAEGVPCDICFKQMSSEERKFDLTCPNCAMRACRVCVDRISGGRERMPCPTCRRDLRTDSSLDSWDQD